MADLDRRSLLSAAAASVVAGSALAMPAQGSLTSPRAERLRALYAQLDNLPEDSTDDDVNRICHEVYAISDDIMTSPAADFVGLAERAMAVHYWFRPNGTDYCADDPSGEAVRALVAAVLAYTPIA